MQTNASQIASLVATRPAQRAQEIACEQAAVARRARAEAIEETLLQFDADLRWAAKVHKTRLTVRARVPFTNDAQRDADFLWMQRQIQSTHRVACTSIIDVLRWG